MTYAATLPHAHTVDKIEDPPCVTLHVQTMLVQNPSTPGFDAQSKQEMLRAIAEFVERDGLDGYCIVWAVPAPPVVVDLKKASSA